VYVWLARLLAATSNPAKKPEFDLLQLHCDRIFSDAVLGSPVASFLTKDLQ
jgi:hypothetical protein